jgi:hypothetical protein
LQLVNDFDGLPRRPLPMVDGDESPCCVAVVYISIAVVTAVYTDDKILANYESASLLEFVRYAVHLHLPLYCTLGLRVLGLAPSLLTDLDTVLNVSRRFGLCRRTLYWIIDNGSITRYPGSCVSVSQVVTYLRQHRNRLRKVNWDVVDAYPVVPPPHQVHKAALREIVEKELAAAFPDMPIASD